MRGRQHNLVMPDLGLGSAEIQASLWLTSLGAKVVQGDRVLEVVAADVTVDLQAPATGRLIRKAVAEEDTLSVGQVLGVVEEE